MPAFLVTGNPGSGKSALARELTRRGLLAIDPDYDPELSHWKDAAGHRVDGPQSPDQEWFGSHRWVWSRSRMEEVLAGHDEAVFICGIARNQDELLDLFDRTFLLQLDGPTQEARIVFEAQMLRLGAIALDGTAPAALVADELLARVASVAQLRVIGMLGGMSWESSAEYYRLANELVRERLGGLHSARLILASVDFADIEQLQVTGRWERAGELLAEAARAVEAAGAELLLLCSNTMHKVAEQVQDAVSIPLLHLADATAAAVLRAGLTTVALLGTAFTMEQDFYRDRLASHGLTVLVPPAEDRAEVHRVIYEELCLGQVREASRQAYRKVIARLAQAGAEGVILGCTEIELLVGPEDSPVPVFPTTRLHVTAAVEQALAPKPRSE